MTATPVGGTKPNLYFFYHDHFGYVLTFRGEALTSYQKGSEEAAARHFIRLACDEDLLRLAAPLTPEAKEKLVALSDLEVIGFVTRKV